MRFLYLLVAFVAVWVLFRRLVRWTLGYLLKSLGASQDPSVQTSGSSGGHRLVRDPECGVYITEERALPLKSGAEVLHFCSAACRDRYFDREHKLAANA